MSHDRSHRDTPLSDVLAYPYHLTIPHHCKLLFQGLTRIPQHIAKDETDETPSGWRYRVKMENAGSRDVVDLELFARLRIKGLKPDFPKNWEVLYPQLAYGRVPKFEATRRSKRRLAVRIRVCDVDEFSHNILPSAIREKLRRGIATLEDIMSLGSDSTLQVFAFGYDAFSGTRKVFESPLYHVQDIQEGVFARKSLEIISRETYRKTEGAQPDESTVPSEAAPSASPDVR